MESESSKEPVKQVEVSVQVEQDKIIGADMGEIEAGRGDFHNLVDILFVLDTTGSMGWCIKQCKKTIKRIIKKFSDKQYNIKFALELYRDHQPQQYSYVEKHYDLRSEQDIIKVLSSKQCDASGGGDTPEAVMDGLFQGLKKTSWRIGNDGTTKSKRFLFHCCDAPPHGKQYGSSSSDKTWQQKGCPCGITKLDIQGLLVQNKVDYSLIKVGTILELMQSLFKQCFSTKFKRVMPLELKNSGSKKRKAMKQQLMSQGSICSEQDHFEYKEQMRQTKRLKIKHSEYKQDQQQYASASQSSSDQQQHETQKAIAREKGISRKRSMASLVCSQVESGLSDYEKQLEEK